MRTNHYFTHSRYLRKLMLVLLSWFLSLYLLTWPFLKHSCFNSVFCIFPTTRANSRAYYSLEIIGPPSLHTIFSTYLKPLSFPNQHFYNPQTCPPHLQQNSIVSLQKYNDMVTFIQCNDFPLFVIVKCKQEFEFKILKYSLSISRPIACDLYITWTYCMI